jgi:hypothetical protein
MAVSNPIVTADALTEIGTAVISDVLSPYEPLSQTSPVTRNVTGQSTVLFETSFSEYAQQ